MVKFFVTGLRVAGADVHVASEDVASEVVGALVGGLVGMWAGGLVGGLGCKFFLLFVIIALVGLGFIPLRLCVGVYGIGCNDLR